jgi:subtilase family serine protease
MARARRDPIAPDGLTPFDPTNANMVGWAEEISLDVEWAHAIAPGARIVLMLAKTNSDADILSALKYAVDNNLGNIISMSFGANESCLDTATTLAYHDVFANATRKNITLFASSGDEGAALQSCDGSSWVRAVSHPATDPLVTSVGGTELRAAMYCLRALGCDPNSNPPFGTYLSEITWNEGLPYGDFGAVFGFGTVSTGGGFSVVMKNLPTRKRRCRAATRGSRRRLQRGDPARGTGLSRVPRHRHRLLPLRRNSAGAPQWAAITAIANQRAGHPLGFSTRRSIRSGS